MRARFVIVGLGAVLAACAELSACTGDDPVFTPFADGGH